MHNDCIAASKIPPRVAAGACLVWTQVAVAIREVTVPVSPDLFRLRMPVMAASYPAELGNITVEVGDRQNFNVVPIIVAGSTSVTVPLLVSAFVAAATVIRLQSRLRFDSSSCSGGRLVQMATRGIERHEDGLMLLILLKGTGRHLLVLRNNGIRIEQDRIRGKTDPLLS